MSRKSAQAELREKMIEAAECRILRAREQRNLANKAVEEAEYEYRKARQWLNDLQKKAPK